MNTYQEARAFGYSGMVASTHLPNTTPEPTAWSEIREGYRTKTIKSGNVTIVIHRPILAEKERAKRERIVETALSNFGKSKQYLEQGETQT